MKARDVSYQVVALPMQAGVPSIATTVPIQTEQLALEGLQAPDPSASEAPQDLESAEHNE